MSRLDRGITAPGEIARALGLGLAKRNHKSDRDKNPTAPVIQKGIKIKPTLKEDDKINRGKMSRIPDDGKQQRGS